MENKGVAVPTDIYDKEGNMDRIEFHDGKGEFIMQSLWDINDEQTSENRSEFRKWSYLMAERLGYKVKR